MAKNSRGTRLRCASIDRVVEKRYGAHLLPRVVYLNRHASDYVELESWTINTIIEK